MMFYHSLLTSFGLCLTFFSRLPAPWLQHADTDDLPKLSETVIALPIVSLVIGFIPALLVSLLSATSLPTLAVGLITVAVLVMICGALHEDGLSDTVDGFGAPGKSTERRLEIMRDSRIGAFGALALIISVGLRVVLISALIDHFGAVGGALGLLGAIMSSRAAMVLVWSFIEPAGESGLSAQAGQPSKRDAFLCGLFSLCILLAFSFSLPFAALMAGFVMALLFAMIVGLIADRAIGGQTGDILGAAQQVAEIAFFLALTMFIG